MKNKGILIIAIAALSFSFGGLFTKFIPWNPIAICGGRSIFACMFTVTTFILTKKKPVVNKTTILGGFMVFCSMFFYILANKMTTAANTIVLEYTAPIFIIIINFLLFKKKPDKVDVYTMLFVILGIVIFFIDSLKAGNMLGNLVALMAGVIYAFVILNNSFENGDGVSSTLYGQIIAILVGVPFVFQETDFSLPTIGFVMALGLICTGVGYFSLAVGTKYCEPLMASLIAFIEPVLNPILVAVFYGEKMTLLSLFGAAIVLITLMIYNIKKAKQS